MLALGLGLLFLGGFAFCLMVAHLIHFLTIPAGVAADAAGLPLWGCHGIVAAVF